MPAAASFDGFPADWDEEGGDWATLRRLPPEAISEQIVLDKRRLATRLGFTSQVNPGGKKHRLPSGRVPDLWCEERVVGEVKNRITATWRPRQIEDYIKECEATYGGKWRGVLVQGEPDMAPNALPRLTKSLYNDRITAWTVYRRKLTRTAVARRLFP
jgi:hypothetical protein